MSEILSEKKMQEIQASNLILPIIDSREKAEYRYCFGEAFGVPVIKKLEAGDYSAVGLEDILAIERKRTVSELSQNLFEKRYEDWTGRLSKYKHAFIICEFSFVDMMNFPRYERIPDKIKKRIRITGAFINAAIIKLNLKYPNINIVYASSKGYGQYMAECIIKRVTSECKR